ncbi:MAG TPA: hypothetical protein VHW66_06875 [Stellaceae bacterium]|jgi:hypothetical protein|nr:hypothetical protein [Stellaceae bacterium]
MNLRLRRGAIALCLAAALSFAGGSARAVEAGPGTKNFNVPPGVPDHFSNEAEPFAASPAAEGPVPRSTVSRGPRARRVAATHRGGRVVHGRAGRHQVASRRGHGRGGRAVAHTAHSSHTVSHAHTASRPHVVVAKRRG